MSLFFISLKSRTATLRSGNQASACAVYGDGPVLACKITKNLRNNEDFWEKRFARNDDIRLNRGMMLSLRDAASSCASARGKVPQNLLKDFYKRKD